MHIRDLPNDRVVHQSSFYGRDDTLDVLFSLQKTYRVRKGNVCDDVECVPVEPCAQVDVLALESVELPLEDRRAFVGERLEVEKSTQRECRSDGSFEVPVSLGVCDGEYGRDVSGGGFGMEEGVEVALHVETVSRMVHDGDVLCDECNQLVGSLPC